MSNLQQYRDRIQQCSTPDEIVGFLTDHARELAALTQCATVPTQFAYTQFGNRGANEWSCFIWSNDDGLFAGAVYQTLGIYPHWIYYNQREGADAYVHLVKAEWPIMAMMERLGASLGDKEI